MKTIFIAAMLICIKGASFGQEKAPKKVAVTFYNNSALTHKVTFISYAPDETGNGTVQVVLAPFNKTTQTYKVGTKIYLADSKQVDIVMSGKALKGKAFKVISEEDEKKTVNLYDE